MGFSIIYGWKCVQCTDHHIPDYYQSCFNLNVVMHLDFPSVKARNGPGSAQPSAIPCSRSECFIVLWWINFTIRPENFPLLALTAGPTGGH